MRLVSRLRLYVAAHNAAGGDGLHSRDYIYQQVTGWESFEPTLSRAEQADLEDLWEIAKGLPDEWWNRNQVPEAMPKEWWNQMFPSDLNKLIETLYQRRSSLRQLITNFREHPAIRFPTGQTGRWFQSRPCPPILTSAAHSAALAQDFPLVRRRSCAPKIFRGAIAAPRRNPPTKRKTPLNQWQAKGRHIEAQTQSSSPEADFRSSQGQMGKSQESGQKHTVIKRPPPYCRQDF